MHSGKGLLGHPVIGQRCIIPTSGSELLQIGTPMGGYSWTSWPSSSQVSVYLSITRSTCFLVTEIQTVVHTRWRDCQPDYLTCQHKRPDRRMKHCGRSLHPANAACIRRQYRSPKTLDGRPILNILRVHIYIRTSYISSWSSACLSFLWSPSS